jgi:predicted aspartyl protease
MFTARSLKRVSIALGLAATSSAATAASECRMTRVAEWPVRLDRGHLIVDGTLNGKKVGVMLDTGGVSMIPRSAADRLGLTRHTARGYRAFGMGGESYVESTIVEEFKVGELGRKSWEVMVAGETDLGKSTDVILGEDVFDKVDLEFDLPHSAVRLFRVENCEGVALGYWAPQGTGQVAIESGPRIIVTVKINGHPVQAELDSGASVSVLDKPVAARLGIGPDSPGVTFLGKGGGIGANAVDYWIAPVESFAIGGEAISDTAMRFADLFRDATYTTRSASRLPQKIENMPTMLLGADFLRAHRVLVAHSQRKMYFTYEGGPVFQPKPPESRRAALPQESAKPAESAERSDPPN